ELDPTMLTAEREHIQSDLIAVQLDVARLQALLSGLDEPDLAFNPPSGASSALVAAQRQFLLTRSAEHRAKLGALDGQQSQKEAERSTIDAAIAKINATIEVAEQRLGIRKALYDTEFGSKLQYLEILQQLVELRQELHVQKSRFWEA